MVNFILSFQVSVSSFSVFVYLFIGSANGDFFECFELSSFILNLFELLYGFNKNLTF